MFGFVKNVHHPVRWTSRSGRNEDRNSPNVGRVHSTAITSAAIDAHGDVRPFFAAAEGDVAAATMSDPVPGVSSVLRTVMTAPPLGRVRRRSSRVHLPHLPHVVDHDRYDEEEQDHGERRTHAQGGEPEALHVELV